jgi:hypothetical protein
MFWDFLMVGLGNFLPRKIFLFGATTRQQQ